MIAASKLATLKADLLRSDLTPIDKTLHLAARGAIALRLGPGFEITRCVIVEATTAPKKIPGLRDLVVRRGGEADVAAVCAVEHMDPALVRGRLARGDLLYLGELGQEVLCYTWFHRGPAPFDEDRRTCVSWAVAESSFWSYDGMARADARKSGVFVKLFQMALGEVFEIHGARRVQGYINCSNRQSRLLHERMGFATLGKVTAVAVLGAKLLRWDGAGRSRQWLLRRDSDFALALPPP